MEGTLAKCCLNELWAIELFEGDEWKTFKNESCTTIRHYLSHEKRQLLSNLPIDTLITYFQPGELIHVPMLPEEESIIIQMRRLSPEISFTQIAEILPGRTADHVKMYISDFENNTIGRKYLYLKDDVVVSSVSPAIDAEPKHWVEKLSKQFSVISLHGAINTIACRTNTDNSRVMVGCCTINAIEYNRNELMMLTREGRNDVFKAYELDGHYTELRDRRIKRETVTSIVYDVKSDIFISAGYDGRVLAWDAEWGSCIAQLGAHNSRINTVACHSRENIVCYGLQSGSVQIAGIPSKGTTSHLASRLFLKKSQSDNPDINTIDWLAFPSSGGHTDSLYVGIGHLQSLHGGVVEVWDVNEKICVNSSEIIGQGLTCMNVSKCGKFLAAGSGCILDGVNGDGIIRVFSTDSHLQSGIKIRSKMFDIDSVSFCPQSKLLFVSETSDSSVAVYDLRYAKDPIFTTRHANKPDEMVSHTWIDGGRMLVTGGNDQTVKIWDCSRSFELLDTFHFNISISCIECNEADKTIWVGEDNGEVTMIAPNGSVNESQPRELEGMVTF